MSRLKFAILATAMIVSLPALAKKPSAKTLDLAPKAGAMPETETKPITFQDSLQKAGDRKAVYVCKSKLGRSRAETVEEMNDCKSSGGTVVPALAGENPKAAQDPFAVPAGGVTYGPPGVSVNGQAPRSFDGSTMNGPANQLPGGGY